MRLQPGAAVGPKRAMAWAAVVVMACDGSATNPSDGGVGPPPDIERGVAAMAFTRLTARHLGAVLKVISNDANCGFESEAVKSSVQVDGQPDDDGTATWKVEGCTIVFDADEQIDSDCSGHALKVKGAVTISATRTVHGVLQRDRAKPVAPDSPSAATITLQEVRFTNFTVQETGGEGLMTVNRGTFHATAVPRLAPDRKLGICTVTTPQLTLHDVSAVDAEVQVSALGHSFGMTIPSATLELQIGAGPEHENWLAGQVIAWDTMINVPTSTDQRGLDPSYTHDGFIQSYACNNELQQPLGGACPPPRERPAQGAAALSVQLFAAVARQLDQDTSCGFAKPGLAGTPTGARGDKGSLELALPAPCTLTFAPGTVVDVDCNGKQTVLGGSVTVTGKKTMLGYLVGDQLEPVVPASSLPVSFELELQPNELRVSTSTSPNALTAHSGKLTGTLEPMTWLDSSTGVCSIATPIAHLTLAHESFVADLEAEDTTVALTLTGSTLEAQAGSRGDKTNYLKGQVMAGGRMLPVPSAGAAPVLDPSYDPDTFKASFACKPNLQMPGSDDDCKLTRKLGEAASRLLMSDIAAGVKLVNGNGGCGFESDDVKSGGYGATGFLGGPGQVTWQTNGYCPVFNSSAQVNWTTDCDSVTTTLEGFANVAAIRTVKGIRYDVPCPYPFCDDFPAVYPTPEDSATFQVWMQFANFASGTSKGRLIIRNGALQGAVRPMQQHHQGPGWYDIGTPVAGFDDIHFMGGDVTLVTDNKTFNFSLGDTQLSAFNGAFKGDKNRISGTTVVDGAPLTLGDLPLKPGYDQTAFDHSYACTEDMAGPIQP